MPEWKRTQYGPYQFELLNLKTRALSHMIQDDMKTVDVTYDTRWGPTDLFAHLLVENNHLVKDKQVLCLGAGIGVDTLVIGRLCRKLYLNDLSSVALSLCEKQLLHNDIRHFESVIGSFENIPVPDVDIVTGCYLVYDAPSATRINRFILSCDRPILLMNDRRMEAFTTLLNSLHTVKTVHMIHDTPKALCVLVT